MLRTIVRNVVRPEIIVEARRAPATDVRQMTVVRPADVRMTAEARRAANRAESMRPVRSAWSFRYTLNFCRNRIVSLRWFGRFIIQSALIR